ncbi:MAG: hypothetical protein K8T90_18145 [Planctomycetes bacterium]|nr:hypothetical protein [Planctomycetota bacterium]
MRTLQIAAAVLAVPFFLAATAGFPAAETDWTKQMGGLPFVVGMERGRDEAKFTGLPPMVFFTSGTDPDSARFGAAMWKDDDVRAKVAGYTPILVDWDTADEAFRKKCHADVVPTVAWLKHDETWIWACIGNAPADIFRKECEIARKACPKPNEPAAGMKLLPDLQKQFDDAAAAKDVKAQLAALGEIRKLRFGESFQTAARAADERLTKEGMDAIAAIVPVFEDKKAPAAKKAEAKKSLEKLADDYGPDHPVAKAARAAIEAASAKPAPKPKK